MWGQNFTLKSFSVSILGFFAPGRAGEAGKWSQSCGKSYLSVSRLRERKGLCCVKEARSLLWKKGEIYIFLPNYTDRRRPSQKKRKNIVNQSKFGQDEMGKNTKKKESFIFWTKRPRLGFWGCLWRQMKSRSSQAGILSHLVGGAFNAIQWTVNVSMIPTGLF